MICYLFSRTIDYMSNFIGNNEFKILEKKKTTKNENSKNKNKNIKNVSLELHIDLLKTIHPLFLIPLKSHIQHLA